MKDINCKVKLLNSVVYLSRGRFLELQLSRICLVSTKKRQICQKSN